jgi:nucleotide-binding universal stress UspA family protein
VSLRALEYRTIVVCVTDTAESMHAVAVAARLVPEKGELVFVHMLEVPLEFALDAPPPPEEESALRAANDLLGRCQALAERYGVSSRRVLERRHVVGPTIVEVAARHRASLVVIGVEHSFTRTGRLRLGATATYVLKHAACRAVVISPEPQSPRVVAEVA